MSCICNRHTFETQIRSYLRQVVVGDRSSLYSCVLCIALAIMPSLALYAVSNHCRRCWRMLRGRD